MRIALVGLLILMLIIIPYDKHIVDGSGYPTNGVRRNMLLDTNIAPLGQPSGVGVGGEKTIYYGVDDGWYFFDVDIFIDQEGFRVYGEYRKFVGYRGGFFVATPFMPPVPCITRRVSLPDNYRVLNVSPIFFDSKIMDLGQIALTPPAIRFSLINYTEEMGRFFDFEPVLDGIFPANPIVNWIRKESGLDIVLATAIYNLSSGEAYIAVHIRVRVFYEAENNMTSRNRGPLDAVIITTNKYYENASEYASLHPDYNIEIVTTEWIYKNYEEAEPPPLPGFADEYHPSKDKLMDKYNFSLALRIIRYLRSLKDAGIRFVILFGNVIDVPPSYYYWDDGFYSEYRDAYQSWIPTDFFYASPDYDYFPEFAVGRIPFLGQRDIEQYIQKLDRWLHEYSTNNTWKWRISLVGGMPFGMLYFSGEATILEILNSGYLGNLTVEKFFETNARYTQENVRQLYRGGGSIFVLEFSHGTETAFYKLSKFEYRWIRLVDTGYLSSLPNASQLPIVVAPACSSGAFDYGIFGGKLKHSLGQAMIFSEAGGIAYVGMSRIAFGALAFYFDEGVLRVPIMLYAQGILKNFFKAYHDGALTLGETYKVGLEYFVMENYMDYWINIRTLLETTLLGDPLLPLPRPDESEDPPSVSRIGKGRLVSIPLTFGEAIQYDENIIKLNVCDDGQVKYVLISPMILNSFGDPIVSTGYVEPTPIGFTLPSGGLYILKVIDRSGKELRVYIRGTGARFRDAKIELLDTNSNGKYELMRLNVTVDFGYFSKTSIVWGFRAWIRFAYAGEGRFRINKNIFLKAKDVGEQTLTFLFDTSPLIGGGGILSIDFLFFSWWPYLFTWWYCGPSIWTEFAIRIITTIPHNSLERAVDIALRDVKLRNLDEDAGVEAADLYFTIRINCRLRGNLEAMLYLQRKVFWDKGGRIYFLSSLIPFIIPTYKEEVVIRYVWALKAWYAAGSWGTPPPEENATIYHYYSFAISLRLRTTKLSILNTGNRQIKELDNIVADGSTNKTIIIESVDVTEVKDTNNNTVGIGVTFTGYSKYPHFERTELILEKYVDGGWSTIYSKELTMGVFIFFWPAVRTRFRVCYIPIEFLGEGTFRVTIRAFKYVSGGKIILAENSTTFTISNISGGTIGAMDVELVDQDEDSRYGHLLINTNTTRIFDMMEIKYSLYWYSGDGETKFSSGKFTMFFTSTVERMVSISGEKLSGLENISIKAEISIFARDQEYLFAVPYKIIVVLAENISGRSFEGYLMDFEKKLRPVVFMRELPLVENSTNVSFIVDVYAGHSARTGISIMLNGTPIIEMNGITNHSSRTIELTGLEEARYNISINISYSGYITWYSLEFTIDLSPPTITMNAISPYNKLYVMWKASDRSGIRTINIYINGSKTYASNDSSGIYIADMGEGPWLVEIEAIDNAGWKESIGKVVLIDKTPPKMELISPPDRIFRSNETRINITWSVSDESGIKYIKIIADLSNIYYVYSGSSITIELGYGEHIVELIAMDNAGNTARIFIKIYIEQRKSDTTNTTLTMSASTSDSKYVESKAEDQGRLTPIGILLVIPALLILSHLTKSPLVRKAR